MSHHLLKDWFGIAYYITIAAIYFLKNVLLLFCML